MTNLQGVFSTKLIRGLIDYLNERTIEYDEGKPTITDGQWDDSYFQLKEIEESTGIIFPDSPTQKISYQIVSGLEKVKHNHDMLSLGKTKSDAEVEEFVGMMDYLAMGKMDGLTMSLRYVDGKLVSAETRGDGTIGENVFHNAMVVKNIPKEIPYKEELVVDGEVICTLENFKPFELEYKNPRNFASGSIRLLDSKECEKRNLSFILWDVIKGLEELDFLNEKFNILMNCGFDIVPWIRDGSIQEQKEFIVKTCKEKGYLIDGIVFKYNSVSYSRKCGKTAHHFKNAIAFKFSEDYFETDLLNIEWTMGRTGVLTPVAVFTPIDIDGSTVQRANLHNLSILKSTLGKTPYIGQRVSVFKANAIIPQILPNPEVEDVGRNNNVSLIDKCPVCGGGIKIVNNDSIEFVYCDNPKCDGKLTNKLEHFFGKKGIDAKGLSKATFEKLIEWGWVLSVEDVFNLEDKRAEWIEKSGYGNKSVSKILDSISNSKETTLDKFICGLGIPLIGATAAKVIAKNIPSYEDFKAEVKNKGFMYDGFGEAMRKSIFNFDYSTADNLAKNYITFGATAIPKEKELEISTSLSGVSVAITGKLEKFSNRNELVGKIESCGGRVVSSVSKNTSYLINNDAESNSAKNLKAKSLGVEIITEENFIKKFF